VIVTEAAMNRTRFLIAVLLLGASHGPLHAACASEPFTIPYWGVNGVTAMAVSSGEPCSIPSLTGGTSMINAMQVSAPPRNGTARVGNDAVWYQSHPGFVGPDAFEFTVSGTTDGRPGSSTVRVQVTVQ
jgi:hypothetical protein